MFEYPVLNDEEIKAEHDAYLAGLKPLEPGTYDFQVTDAKHKIVESTGNHMMELKLKVWTQDGKELPMFDWLVATKSMAFKTKNFWASVGHPEKYNTGKAETHDFINQMGKLETKLGKDKKGNTRAQVKDYVPAKKEEAPFDDDINF